MYSPAQQDPSHSVRKVSAWVSTISGRAHMTYRPSYLFISNFWVGVVAGLGRVRTLGVSVPGIYRGVIAAMRVEVEIEGDSGRGRTSRLHGVRRKLEPDPHHAAVLMSQDRGKLA